MIRHYIKVACRNLLRYKTQSIISIIGLAVGFTCFALATLWVRYELTYDSFHKDADRIYMLYGNSEVSLASRKITIYPHLTAETLQKDFPEVEGSCAVYFRGADFSTEEQLVVPLRVAGVDSAFVDMFDVRLLDGTMDFLHTDEQIAITPEAAVQLFGSSKGVIGKAVEVQQQKRIVGALVQGWGKHTNLTFDALTMSHKQYRGSWSVSTCKIWMKLNKGVDQEAFREKLRKHNLQEEFHMKGLEIMPITQCRYEIDEQTLTVQLQYLVMFCITGGLVILCALLNYLSLFASRLQMRIREMALRKVCGSSGRRMYGLLAVDFLLVLMLAALLGMTFIELSLPYFQELSGVYEGIYASSLLYFAGVMVFSMCLFLLVYHYFSRHALKQALKGGGVMKSKKQLFYRGSIVLQLVISILFLFCIGMIAKQLYYLRNGDIGMERKNILSMQFWNGETAPVLEHIKKMPTVTDVTGQGYALIPRGYFSVARVAEWEGKQPADEPVEMEEVDQGEIMMDFFQFKLLKGERLAGAPSETHQVMLNETAVKAFGWDDPVGKTLVLGDKNVTVLGVVKDFHKVSPTLPVSPIFITSSSFQEDVPTSMTILMKYQPGQLSVLRNAIDTLMQREFPSGQYMFSDLEETYEEFLRSESALLKLLGFVAVVCVLISVFGIYSFVTLTCERRRKEIAIRKVNGARVKDVLLLFLKEYMLLLAMSSVVAFSVGYALMKRWLESYMEQTAISWWVYAAVFTGIACVVLLSIWTRVWKAAHQNPAEVIKSE